MSHRSTSPAFDVIHSAFNGSARCGTVRVARTGKEYGFSLFPNGNVILACGTRAVPDNHLRDVRHFLRDAFPHTVADAAAPAAADRPALDGRRDDGDDGDDDSAAAEAARRDRLESEGHRFDNVLGRWVHSGIEHPTVFGFDTLRECMDDAEGIEADDGRPHGDPECDGRCLPAPSSAPAAPLPHADEWRTRRSTWIPLSAAIAAALATFLPGAGVAAPFDPGFARAGADPASNAMALALWLMFLAAAAGIVLCVAGRPRPVRPQRDRDVLRVRCRRVPGR